MTSTTASPRNARARRRRGRGRSRVGAVLGGLCLAAALGAGALGDGLLGTASPRTAAADEGAVMEVVEVSGYLDGIMADFITRSARDAAGRGSLGLVLQADSPRTTVSDERLAELADQLAESEISVFVWVGPSGSVLTGAGAQLAGLADDLALAPGSRLGDVGEPIVPLERFSAPFRDAYPSLRSGTVSAAAAIEMGLAREAPTLPFFVLDLPGFESEIDDSGEEAVRVPVSRVRFAKLPLLDQVMHTVASPAIAYLLMLAGAGLLLFELYTAGVGIAATLGALSFTLGGYGLAALPTRAWAVGLLMAAMFGYAVDIQTGMPRVWTALATMCLIVGSLTLYQEVRLSWVALLAGVGGTSLGMIAGMPAMVRTRFGTPTIGREWMIGATGVAHDAVDPEGVVLVEGAPWRARTLRTTPIAEGDEVRVTSLDGLFLNVEPYDADEPSDADEPGGAPPPSEPAGPTEM